MKIKNLNTNITKLTAVIMAGTMSLSAMTGCSRDEISIDGDETYIELMEMYTIITKDYKTARDLYSRFPTDENLQRLYVETIKMDNKCFDVISEKLGFNAYGYIKESKDGRKEYIIRNFDDENIAFTHYVTSKGNSFGEINPNLIINGMELIYQIPQTEPKEWNEKDIETFKYVAENIADNLEELLFTEIKSEDGNIIQGTIIQEKKLQKENK